MMAMNSSYFENFDPEDLIMTQLEINQLQPFDKSAEIIGISADLEVHTEVFKFTLNNRKGQKIQVISWADTRGYIEPLVKSGAIMHLDGVYVKPKDKYSKSSNTIPVDLIIKSNTSVSCLKLLSIPQADTNTSDQSVSYTDLEDALNDDGVIVIECYLQQKIGEILTNKNDRFYQGAITDLKKKLTIRLQEEAAEEINVGDFIEIKGRIIETSKGKYYLAINSSSDIKIIERLKKHFTELMDICSNAKRKCSENLEDSQNNNEKKTKN